MKNNLIKTGLAFVILLFSACSNSDDTLSPIPEPAPEQKQQGLIKLETLDYQGDFFYQSYEYDEQNRLIVVKDWSDHPLDGINTRRLLYDDSNLLYKIVSTSNLSLSTYTHYITYGEDYVDVAFTAYSNGDLMRDRYYIDNSEIYKVSRFNYDTDLESFENYDIYYDATGNVSRYDNGNGNYANINYGGIKHIYSDIPNNQYYKIIVPFNQSGSYDILACKESPIGYQSNSDERAEYSYECKKGQKPTKCYITDGDITYNVTYEYYDK